jgi:WD40 repeat protein
VVRSKHFDGARRGALRHGRLTLIDPRSGEVILERELDWQPRCAAYSPDGSVLAIGTDEGRVLLFETGRYTQQLEWRAHEGEDYSYVYSLAWTPDGTRLATASGDATLKVWDTRTRVASRLADDRWQTQRAEMATRIDLRDAFAAMTGGAREAARVELIRRAHLR